MHINIRACRQNNTTTTKNKKKIQNVNAQFEEICKSDYEGPRTFESRLVYTKCSSAALILADCAWIP